MIPEEMMSLTLCLIESFHGPVTRTRTRQDKDFFQGVENMKCQEILNYSAGLETKQNFALFSKSHESERISRAPFHVKHAQLC